MEEKDLSENILKLVKDTKGLGIKSAIKLFEESEALTEDLQLVVIDNFIEESEKVEIISVVRKGIIIEIDKKELQAFKDAKWQELKV